METKKLTKSNVLLFFFLLVNSFTFAQLDNLTPGEVIREVSKSLNDSKAIIESSNLPPLTTVDITLETTQVEIGSGSIKILIFTFGKKKEKKATKKLTFVLEPKAEKSPQYLTGSLSAALSEAIVEVAEALKVINDANIDLKPKSTAIEFGFYITKSTTGGLVWDVLPISASVSGKYDRNRTGFHSVKLFFGTK